MKSDKVRLFWDRKLVLTRSMTKRVEDNGDTRWVDDGKEEFEYELTLDMVSINRVAFAAAHNKTGKAKRGGLEVKIVGRKRI